MTEKVKQQHMFSNKMIAGILIPVVLEQLLNGNGRYDDGK